MPERGIYVRSDGGQLDDPRLAPHALLASKQWREQHTTETHECIVAGISMPRRLSPGRPRGRARRRNKTRTKTVKKDPIFVDGERPRPMYVDYKDVEFLQKLVNRHGRIVVRRKTGCSAISQHAVTRAVKRARFMALLPYVGD